MQHQQFLKVESLENNIFTLGINRPERKNALNTALVVHIADTIEQLISDHTAKAIIIYGLQGNFAAGADIDEIATLSPKQALLDARVAAWMRIRQCSIPLIAAVEGYCLGGGMELLLSCDFAIADKNAKFGLPEVKLGIMPGAGGTQILPRLIGKNRAARMIYTGEIMSASTMAEWGVVTELCDDVLEQAKSIATKIARNAPFAISQAKRSLNNSVEMGLEAAMNYERQVFSLLASTEDKKEGIAAFKQKRHAVFTGQ
ncbi:enoyl-CoA hydratase/isomerase family protein [Psychrobacter lutiphocae]|uniref:enoyl-CoA hydratase/isomerase family protein n=1 Tax=Psychrobacter lutiphocae TaxID=540500 RepID=UPI00036D0390|nr:enoyl-CoA hydratase-related protein [Psychrobacter lutiphocae]